MKRRFTVCLALIVSSAMLTGCDEESTTTTSSSSGAGGGTAGAGGEGGGGQGGQGGGTPDVCGDGFVTATEACDDGNLTANDGCDAKCTIESGFSCSGEPSTCVTICGDGVIAGAETCDDANANPGDGCDGCGVESGFSCMGAPSTCVTTCGDGVTAGTEACDDNNTNAGDGCDGTCVIESGYQCTGMPSACMTTCGDGVTAGTEACDDNNTNAGDGCNATCAIESGFACNGAPSVCVTTCGDGITAGTEACDDSNTLPSDGCDSACAIEMGYSCMGQPSACVTTCGDGITAGNEACDDLNATDGDGCSMNCLVESGFSCAGQPSACITTCGDGIVAGMETCDDSNMAGGDGCNANCAAENGYVCTGQPSACTTVCGDGIIAGIEACDDNDMNSGDGCNASCAIENGFTCMGQPSACATTCGDSIIAGSETCDDGGMASGDGCSNVCTAEPGYTCSGAPSICATTCGDGLIAGDEECDDGNTANSDGCNAACQFSSGENCDDTISMTQAAVDNNTYRWAVPAGSVTATDGSFSCDASTLGPDVVIAYVKTSANLANGGKLLHVKADTPNTSTTANYLNLEITDKCLAGNTTFLECHWYKENWDAYLDVPAGTYYIWVQKNSPGAFPDVNVVAEEIDAAQAEGEGCFAPYSSASSIYTPPTGMGQPHTWTLPASINSFDMSSTWGEPGSITCDNTPPYGDIHGVDSVIEYEKQSPMSVLKIDVQNNDPTLTQSDLNVEVLNLCDPLDMGKISRHCRARLDTISITAPSPAGPAYVWVSSEATGQEFNGATVQITEIFPAPGESWPTAEPLAGSGPIVATSTQRLDAPTCIPAGSNVHWFSYTLTQNAFSLRTDVAGAIGVYDEGGQQRACVTDASTAPIAFLSEAGKTFYMAVQSPTTIGNFIIGDFNYTGVGRTVTDMQITFPTSAISEFGMTVNGNEIIMGDTSSVFAFANIVGATAAEYGSTSGITTAHLGYDLVALNGSIFSVDSITTTTSSRLFRIFDGTTWGPGTTWDTPAPTYPASSPTHGIGTDGTNIYMSTRRSTTSANFYQVLPGAPNTPTLLGTNTSVWNVSGLAVDDQYFYVASNGSSGEGVYRITRANVTAAPVKIATIDTNPTAANIEVSAFVNPPYLYVRAANGDTHAIANPAAGSPTHVGAINTLGTTSDYAMAYDKTNRALYIFETESDSAGVILKIE